MLYYLLKPNETSLNNISFWIEFQLGLNVVTANIVDISMANKLL